MAWGLDEVSAEGSVLATLAPGLILTAFFVLGLPIFAVRCLHYGVPRDLETERRGASVLVGFFLRHYFFWLVRPLFRALLQSGLPATALTGASTVLGAASGIAVASGRFSLGGWSFLLAGILDALDGRLARARGDATPAGAVIDSVLDRYTDAFLLIGLAWYYRTTWVLVPVLGALLGSSLVPYVRARGEALGVSLHVGVMQRLERVLVLGGSLALSPLLDALLSVEPPQDLHRLAVFGIVVTAVSSNLTAISRFRAVVRVLSRPPAREVHSRRT